MGSRAGSRASFSRRGGVLAAALAGVMAVGPWLPAAARKIAAPGAVNATPTWVTMTATDIAGLDEVYAQADASYAHLDGSSSGNPLTCVSARRTTSGTETRGGVDVEVWIVQSENGCASTAYRFDEVTWRAHAVGTVPTEVWTDTYERGPDGWLLVSGIRESKASASVTLDWQGTGEQRVTPRVVPPSVPPPICYAPPFVCPGGSVGVVVSRDAAVEGSVRFGGLGTTAVLPSGQAGTMRWWAGR